MKLFILLLILLIGLAVGWWFHRDARLSVIPKQGITLLALKPQFESWSIEWSYGWNSQTTLWHRPTFRHLDMSKLFVATNILTTNFMTITNVVSGIEHISKFDQ